MAKDGMKRSAYCQGDPVFNEVWGNMDKQKVEVYKISLRKAHKLKAGMTYVKDKTYLSAGYQAGQWEGLAHFNAEGFKGATVMYTLKEW